MRKKTYNARDLDPSEINRFFKSEFTKQHDKWSRSRSGSSGGGGSFLEIIKVNANNAYSDSEFKDYLREHGLTVDIQGTNIIPKSVDVYALNVGTFVASIDSGLEVKRLSEAGVKTDLLATVHGNPVDDQGRVVEDACDAMASK